MWRRFGIEESADFLFVAHSNAYAECQSDGHTACESIAYTLVI